MVKNTALTSNHRDNLKKSEYRNPKSETISKSPASAGFKILNENLMMQIFSDSLLGH